MIFRKRRGAAMIFAVSFYLPIIFTNVPGRGDKSTSLNRGCILQFISSQGSQRTAQKAVNLFLILKLGYCPQCVTATLAAERQPGSDPSMSLIAARSIRHL
jgi:hypothetical protein